MPFRTFHGWLFDGNIKREIPNKEVLLKYNSPITPTYVISLFLNNGKLNFFLNRNLNNISLRYLEKEELFKFIKKCVIDFRVQRRSLLYKPYEPRSKLFNALRSRIPTLKNYDILLLCELIEKMDKKEKNALFSALDLIKYEKERVKHSKQKKEYKTIKEFIDENFSVVEVGSRF